jgi:hypothetical protein
MEFSLKTFIIVIIGCLLLGNASAQTEIKIKNFSERYYAKVISKPDSSSYYIQVYEKLSNKRLIEAAAEQISDNLVDENDQLIPNVKELPYGDQSVLIYEDFNFDGIKDFALMNGFQSCYGGPSFDIYLFINNTFTYSPGFSELSNSYCGMFQVDTQRKKIMTMTKSGCCWHQYSEYIVKDNVPVAVKIVEESAAGGNAPYFVEITTKELTEGSMKEKTKLYMPYQAVDTVLSFKLKKNKKTACVFSLDSVLYYALIRQDGSIEFSFPQPDADVIHYNAERKSIGFKNKDVYYEIFKEGIKVKLPDQEVNIEADSASIKGGFNNSLLKNYSNVSR